MKKIIVISFIVAVCFGLSDAVFLKKSTITADGGVLDYQAGIMHVATPVSSSEAVSKNYADTMKAADSDLLDGQDILYFAIYDDVKNATSTLRTDLNTEISATNTDFSNVVTATSTLRTDVDSKQAELSTTTWVAFDSNKVGGKSYTGYITPVGAIIAYGGASAPDGWVLCNGASLVRTGTYADLFAAIGTAYGTADGTHFNVPDARGMFLRGVDAGLGRDPDAGARTIINIGGNTGDNVGSQQAEALDSHAHFTVKIGEADALLTTTKAIAEWRASGADDAYQIATKAGVPAHAPSQEVGGNETRPVNIYVNYIIKY